MSKLELFNRIQKLSEVVHSHDIAQYNLNPEIMEEMRRALDEMSEQFVNRYC